MMIFLTLFLSVFFSAVVLIYALIERDMGLLYLTVATGGVSQTAILWAIDLMYDPDDLD